MRKFYSLVLMAAGLLIGTNAWAATQYASNVDQVNQYLADATTTEVILQSGSDDISFVKQLVLNNDKHIVLNLAEKNLTMSVGEKVAILVERGTLEIKNGTITNSNVKTIDLIRVIGDCNTGWDAANGNTYSRVIIDEDAYVINSQLITSGTKYNAITIIENATKVGGNSYANGARIDVYGKKTDESANAEGYTYGIKINGSIKKPADPKDAPYVYIHDGAIVKANASNNGSVAAYSSGYGRWLIEGLCQGATGLYIKGGEVVLDGAQIKTTDAYNTGSTTGGSSGVNAGGSAIVIESNVNYPGDSKLTVTGNTTVEAGSGYAIEEKLDDTNADAQTNQVESITIESGTITGGAQGAIVVTTETKGETTIYGGNISAENNETPIQVTNNGTALTGEALTNAIKDLLPEGTDVTPSSTTSGTKTTFVINAGYNVTLNAYGLATFSAAERTLIPTGLKAYAAGALNGDALELAEVTGAYVPATTGVILWNEEGANKSYSMAINTTGTASEEFPATNNLKADWAARTAATVYILHGNELWEYTGSEFKDNKAYLQLDLNPSSPNPAPKRIVLKFDEAQAVDNVETETVKAVKFVGADGQLYIRRGEAVYTIQGQVVK